MALKRRPQAIQRPQEAPVPTQTSQDIDEGLVEPLEPLLDVQEPQDDEPWVNPLILAAQRGEQVEFGSEITPVDGAPAETDPDDTQE